MGAVYFYHLTRSPLERALPALLKRARGAGWRVMVRGPDAGQLERLDRELWLAGGEDSFAPHGIAGGPFDALQPVLLTTEEAAANDPQCLMAVGGADVSAEEVAGFERVCILFDGGDNAAVTFARGQWKALTGAGAAAQYWSEEGGRWEMKHER